MPTFVVQYTGMGTRVSSMIEPEVARKCVSCRKLESKTSSTCCKDKRSTRQPKVGSELPMQLDSIDDILPMNVHSDNRQKSMHQKDTIYLIKVHFSAGLFIDLVCKLHYTSCILHVI